MPDPIKLKYSEISGLVTKRALAEHYKLYESYRDMLERADNVLNSTHGPEKPELEHPVSAASWAQSYALSGVLLHEAFFSNMSPNPQDTDTDRFWSFISEVFGSKEDFVDLVSGTALNSRGWVVVGVLPGSPKSLRVFNMDSHDLGAVFGYSSILVLDIWEHAYWMDFGASKKDYITKLIEHIDWSVVCDRFCAIT